MSSTLPLPPKPDFEALPSRPPPERPTLTTLTIVLAIERRAVPLATIRTAEEETIIVATIDDMTPGTTSLIEGIMTAEEIVTATVRATMTTVVTDAALFATATGIEPTTAAVIMKNGIMTVTVDAIAHRADVPEVGGGIRDRGHPAVVHPPEIVAGVPRRLHRDAAHHDGVHQMPAQPQVLSAPPEPKSSPRPDSATDVRRPQHGPSQSPASPQRPPSTKVCPSPTPASSTLVDKGKAKVTPQSTAAFINEDVKMVDLAPPHSPQSIDQPRKPSPQPPVGGHLSPHPSLLTNSKRSRTSQSQTNAPAPNTSRLSPNFRLPPIPPHEVKEVVKESLNKEIARLASLNVSQKAAAEPLTRVAERSRHELEMSLLELYAAGERRKAAAAQVEEARAGTLGIGSGLEYSAKVSYS
ncbi:hypothetical protein BC826DRAFT_1185410 [Russula brevipes]|nr:hypothetical protein BC826DRAFT_1185410 [Russula brevipes]